MSKDNYLNFISLIVLLGCIFLCAGISHADEWDEQYEKGKLALERGNWSEAVSHFQNALKNRPNPDPQAATASLKLVEYVPYFYLGQAYFFSGNYENALQNFQKSLHLGAIDKTASRKKLDRMLEITRSLIELRKQESQSQLEASFEKRVSELQGLILNGNHEQAQKLLAQLKLEQPGDKRIAILEKWWQQEQKQAAVESEKANLSSAAQQRFDNGLDYFLTGQYQKALQEFRAVQNLDPEFGAVKSWIGKTQTEVERLKLDENNSTKEPVQPEVIEKIITQTTAPVLAIRSPTDALTETRAKEFRLSGQAGDDQGIAYIEIAINGQPLRDQSGAQVVIQPTDSAEARKFSFLHKVPLKMGENQIVLSAYDVDSPPHRTLEQFSVTRKPAVYHTTVFWISLGGGLVLVLGGLFITKTIKYRIAIVNKYNPYIAGSPIRNEEMFFGREMLIQRILNTLHNNSLMIYGPRRIGKTSLQHQLKLRLENLQDPDFQYVPVLIDLQGTTEDRFFATLMEEILEVCKARLNGALDLKFYEKLGDYSGRDFSGDLKTVLQTLSKKIPKKLKLVLLIDEVDELNKYSEQINQKLRSVFMKTFAEHLVAVMSGAHIRKSWESEGSPWYNFFEEIEVPPFEKEDAVNLIKRPVAGIFSYEEDAVEKIIEYSDCQPYIIQRLCVNVINRIIEAKRRRVTLADVEAVRAQVD